MQIGQFTNKNKQKLFCEEICFPKNPSMKYESKYRAQLVFKVIQLC